MEIHLNQCNGIDLILFEKVVKEHLENLLLQMCHRATACIKVLSMFSSFVLIYILMISQIISFPLGLDSRLLIITGKSLRLPVLKTVLNAIRGAEQSLLFSCYGELYLCTF